MKQILFDLSGRGRIKVTGEDRARLLHAMTTNHVQDLQPGQGHYAFFLNAQGRIQADVYILCFPDHFLLDTEPDTRLTVYEHLDRFIIADDVTLDDVTDSTFCLSLDGLGPTFEPYSHTTADQVTTAAITATGNRATRYYGPLDKKADLIGRLEAEGATPGNRGALEMARVRNFFPRFGVDITAATLPQESQMMHAVHFKKGCYLGQEIVERVRSRGHVNRTLMGFTFPGEAAPPAGTVLTDDGKETGEVTSSVATPEGVFGLAYVRVPHNKPGATVSVDGHSAQLFPPANV